jgi:hypothetical protein
MRKKQPVIRPHLTVRFAPARLAALRAEAKKDGRSLSEVVERRVEESFKNDVLAQLKRGIDALLVLWVRKRLDADRQNRRPPGRPRKILDSTAHDVQGFAPTGNSAAAALRRLERHRRDLLERVLAGELSAHAAMIEAGFRNAARVVPCST